MLVGVVKLAPSLPIDANFPFLHLENKFMHLGFHIYDVGFQSPNVDAARPLVFATALLLVVIVIVLNLTAITLRNQPRETIPRGSAIMTENALQPDSSTHAPDGVKLAAKLVGSTDTRSPSELPAEEVCLTVTDLALSYDTKPALTEINMLIPRQRVTALIGPSGCGKSTLIRCFNRMNDLIDGVSITGRIELNGLEIHDQEVDVAQLRRQVGMVFQRPNPFPKSIYENVAYGLRIGEKTVEIRTRRSCGAESQASRTVGRGPRPV